MGSIIQCVEYKPLLTLEELVFKKGKKLCLRAFIFSCSLPSVWVKDHIKAGNHHYH